MEEPEPEPEVPEGDSDKKGNAEGSSDEEGKLVIDEPTKEKNEKGMLKRRAGDLLEVTPEVGWGATKDTIPPLLGSSRERHPPPVWPRRWDPGHGHLQKARGKVFVGVPQKGQG